jgi:hypothetical protein
LAKPIWALVRLCARLLRDAILDAPSIDMTRLAACLADTPRRRKRQASALC